LNIQKLKNEDEKLSDIIEKLEKSKKQLEISLKKIRELELELYKINNDKYNNTLEEIKEDIKKITSLDDADEIIKLIEIISDKVNYLENIVKDEINKLIDEKIKNIEEINKRLQLFAKILLHVLKIEKEIKTFTVPKNKSLDKLNEIEKNAKDHLNEVYSFTIDQLEKIDLDEIKLNILLEWIEKGEIKLNKNNIDNSFQVIKMLIEKGISVRVCI
jgi:DNA repair exonuclease SbcCD ATPase subunit